MTAAADRPRRFFGTITGTSVDGLDLAVLEMGPTPSIVAAGTAPLFWIWIQLLKSALSP